MKKNKISFSMLVLTMLFLNSSNIVHADSLVNVQSSSSRKITISTQNQKTEKSVVKKTIEIKKAESKKLKEENSDSILVVEAKKAANIKLNSKQNLYNPIVVKKIKSKEKKVRIIDPKELDSQINIEHKISKVKYSSSKSFKARRIEDIRKNEANIRELNKNEINKNYNYKAIKIDSKMLEVKRRKVEKEKNAKIMGESKLTRSQFIQYLKTTGTTPKLTCSIEELVYLYLKEGQEEGIRGDLALCQALLETGNFTYGGLVTFEQNNFCGLGSTGKGFKGASFKTAAIGVEAHLQHLMAYATPRAPKKKVIDPRYYLVHNMRQNSGYLPEWKDLNNKWAANSNYSNLIFNIYNKINSIVSLDVADYSKENKKVEIINNKESNAKNKKISKVKQSSFRQRIDKILAARKKVLKK